MLHAATPNEAVQAGLELARTYRETNQTEQAEACLRELVARYPTCRPAEVMFELGHLLFGDSDHRADSVVWLRRAAARAQDDPDTAARAQLFCGYLYGEQGDLDQTAQEFAKLKALFPDDGRRLAQAAVDLLSFRHWRTTEPETLLDEIVSARGRYAGFPDLVGVLDLLSGRLLSLLGRFGEALAFLARVPDDLDFPFANAQAAGQETIACLLQNGDFTAAKVARDSFVRNYYPDAGPKRPVRSIELLDYLLKTKPSASLQVVTRSVESGEVCPYASVYVTYKGQSVWARRTGRDGSVLLNELPHDHLKVYVSAEGFAGSGRDVTLNNGADPTALRVQLQPTPFAWKQLRVLDRDGEQVRNEDIQTGESSLRLARSDERGRIRVQYVPKRAERRIIIRVPGRGVAVVNASALADGAEVRLTSGARLQGSVVSVAADDTPFGAIVEATVGGTTFRTVADPDGRFALGELPPGECTVVATKGRRLWQTGKPVKVLLEDGRTEHDLVLRLRSPDWPFPNR
jgi:tetratricopeptide (TPR) repeat protein